MNQPSEFSRELRWLDGKGPKINSRGKPWSLWLGGFLYLAWAIFGYYVEYVKGIEWRSPLRWSIGGLYLLLYLATVMFYWWPLVLISKPL